MLRFLIELRRDGTMTATTFTASDVARVVKGMSDRMIKMVADAATVDGVRQVVLTIANGKTIDALIRRGVLRVTHNRPPRYPFTSLGLAVRAWIVGDDEAIAEKTKAEVTYGRVGTQTTAHIRWGSTARCSQSLALGDQVFTKAQVQESPYLTLCERCRVKAQSIPVLMDAHEYVTEEAPATDTENATTARDEIVATAKEYGWTRRDDMPENVERIDRGKRYVRMTFTSRGVLTRAVGDDWVLGRNQRNKAAYVIDKIKTYGISLEQARAALGQVFSELDGTILPSDAERDSKATSGTPSHKWANYTCGGISGHDSSCDRATCVYLPDLQAGTVVAAVPAGTKADGTPITRTIRVEIDRQPWMNGPNVILCDSNGATAVRPDSLRVDPAARPAIHLSDTDEYPPGTELSISFTNSRGACSAPQLVTVAEDGSFYGKGVAEVVNVFPPALCGHCGDEYPSEAAVRTHIAEQNARDARVIGEDDMSEIARQIKYENDTRTGPAPTIDRVDDMRAVVAEIKSNNATVATGLSETAAGLADLRTFAEAAHVAQTGQRGRNRNRFPSPDPAVGQDEYNALVQDVAANLDVAAGLDALLSDVYPLGYAPAYAETLPDECTCRYTNKSDHSGWELRHRNNACPVHGDRPDNSNAKD